MKLANFKLDESGRTICTLDVDFKDFDVSHEAYFNGDENHTADEYRRILLEVVKQCNADGNYIVDCYKNRYTVRLESDVKAVRLADMTEDERKQHDIDDLKAKHAKRISELKQKLRDTDYNILKVVEGVAKITDIPEIIAERQAWRKEINELEEYEY